VRILVTGGSGFLGRYFHQALREAGNEVTILDLVAPKWDTDGVRVVQGDVRERTTVDEAMQGAQAVLHLAAAHHDSGIDPATYFSVNETGARVLCDVAGEHNVRSICFTSTVAVYGATPEPRIEDADTRPVTPYGQSKLAAEAIFRSWSGSGSGRRCLVIRPTVIFGPSNFANMYSLIRQVDSGFFVRVTNGENIKSLSYVENLIAAVLFLWRRETLEAFEVYNYVDNPDLQTRALLTQIYTALGRRMPSWWVPEAVALAAACAFDLTANITRQNLAISRARIRKMCAQTRFEADKVLATGFKPPVPLTEGIERTVRWYLQEGRHHRGTAHLPPAELRAQGRRVRPPTQFADE